MFKPKFYLALLCVSTLDFVACSDDDDAPVAAPDDSVPVAEQVTLSYEENPRAYALKFHDYIGGEPNVKRLDADTVRKSMKVCFTTFRFQNSVRVTPLTFGKTSIVRLTSV